MFAGTSRRDRLQQVGRRNASTKLKNKDMTIIARLFGGDYKIRSQIHDENQNSP